MNGGALPPDRRFATTLARGLSVLRAFRPSDDGLGNAEIASRTGLPKSTVSRLTFTLRELGYLTGAPGDRYRPGPSLLVLGNTAAAVNSWLERAGPAMQRLADETRTMALLLVRDGDKMLIARTWRPSGVASIWLETGHRLPFAGTSSGHTLLSALDAPQAASIAALPAAHLDRIRAEGLAQLTTRGFVITDPAQYYAPGIHAVAVPFRPDGAAEPVIFTCGAVPEMLPVARMEAEIGPALRDAVRGLDRLTPRETR
ncbi:IclR family transcriptional regulator [Jannaschia formosa]|nr:IclR family transcriptional regulator [Jannaschia formosa]